MADLDDVSEAPAILQSLARHVNCLGEDNRNTRKRAIEGIRKETLGRKPTLGSGVLQELLRELIKPILKLLSDPVEKCRELSIGFLTDCISLLIDPTYFLSYVIPVLVQRLGQQEIVETSEELRLELVVLLTKLVEISKNIIVPYLDDIVKILQRTIVDPYSEVKKQSCRCAAVLAKGNPEHFHLQSESLVKPLLLSVSHQHSRVRVEVIKAIGAVIQYGNNKSVDDVVSHLAQRMFDQAPAVRMAVTQLIGNWLLDLLDRYSFFHKLMPLLMTSLLDEMPDIRIQAEALWHDVGLKYAGENEDDLKDKSDFAKIDPTHYPKGIERPNIGCRELVYRNFSKILPGLLRDLDDWVAATRVKSSQLLFTLVLHEEENVTQHMEKLLTGLYRACGDEEKEVVNYVTRTAELLGYFVSPEVWVKLVLTSVKATQSPGALHILAAIVRGTDHLQLKPFLPDVAKVISDAHVCHASEAAIQKELLSVTAGLLNVCKDDISSISLAAFTVLVTVEALSRIDGMKEESKALLLRLAEEQGLPGGRVQLFEVHTRQVLEQFQEGYATWTQHSAERLVFDTLIMEAGPVVGRLLEEVIPVMEANLHPDKDPEVRLKFFSLLSRLLMNASATLDSESQFDNFVVLVVRNMVLPNCVWKAGRIATAIRTTAVSCLWALLQSGVFTREKLLELAAELQPPMTSMLEDDSQQTRLITCRVMTHMFTLAGMSLDQDALHNLYPDLLKRLDDSSDDVRVAVTHTFLAYFDCFQDGYEVGLYRAHLEAIYKGLLVHLDDPDTRIQDSVLEVLKKASALMPAILMQEIDAVRLKHRSTKYCDQLTEHMRTRTVKS